MPERDAKIRAHWNDLRPEDVEVCLEGGTTLALDPPQAMHLAEQLMRAAEIAAPMRGGRRRR